MTRLILSSSCIFALCATPLLAQEQLPSQAASTTTAASTSTAATATATAAATTGIATQAALLVALGAATQLMTGGEEIDLSDPIAALPKDQPLPSGTVTPKDRRPSTDPDLGTATTTATAGTWILDWDIDWGVTTTSGTN